MLKNQKEKYTVVIFITVYYSIDYFPKQENLNYDKLLVDTDNWEISFLLAVYNLYLCDYNKPGR